jgi:hypothetical protein
MGLADPEPVEEGNGRTGLEELEPLDLEKQVPPRLTKTARRDHPLTEVGARVGKVCLHALPGESVRDRSHHLLGDVLPGEFALIPGDEGRVLEFIRASAKEAVSVDMGAENDPLGLPTACDEHAQVAVDFHVDFLELAAKDPEKGILGANDGGLADESLKDLKKFGEIGVTDAGIDETGRMTSGNAHDDRRQVPPP